MDPTYLAVLRAGNKHRLKRTLSKAHEWFQHYGSAADLKEIRRQGLRPMPKEPASGYSEHAEGAARCLAIPGAPIPKILCLSIEPRRSFLVLNDTRVLLVVRASALPRRLGFDWSFEFAMLKTEQAFSQHSIPQRAFASAVLASEVLVAYDAIPPDALRVKRVVDVRSNPQSWPLLIQADDDEIEQFAPGTPLR